MSTDTQEPEVQNEEMSQTEGYAEVIRHTESVASGPTAEEHHAAKLTAMREELSNLAVERAGLDEQRKTLKKRYDGLVEQLATAQVRGPEYRPLLDGPASEASEPEAWRALPIDALGLSGGIASKLEEAGIVTIGQLQQAMNGERWWDNLDGIGEGKAEKLADAFAQFWSKHPEYCQEEDEAIASFDFDAEPEEDAE